MSTHDPVASIEAEWETDTGFLWKARHGVFDSAGYERTLAKLQAMEIEEEASVPRRLVSVIWYMPLFLSWQIDRIRESKGDTESYVRAVSSITNEIERLLGTP